MFTIHKEEINWGGKTLTLETGQVARQADGAVIATYGETSVLCTVVAAKKAKPDQNFFPLTVNFQERTAAAGKIPGGFLKREGRPTEFETLTSRLIDRPVRPLFPDTFRNETQIVCTLLSHDIENNPDIPALIGASAALTISGVPFMGPIAGARIGYKDGEYTLNPSKADQEGSLLDLVVAGTNEGVLMVESEAHQLSEEIMLGAVSFGHEKMKDVIKMIVSLAEKSAKDPWVLPEVPQAVQDLKGRIAADFETRIGEAYKITDKKDRVAVIRELQDQAIEAFASEELGDNTVADKFHDIESDVVRGSILKTGSRIDGRDTKTVRQIECQPSFIKKTHGSVLFTRGETQAIVTTTLGTGQDEQIIDALAGEYRERFMLHYNFPPFSVGEAGRMGSPGRREIGHGKLAWRALNPMLPSKEEFPYTIRIVSDITESNGSSSMASVCGGSMAMMDAGVPLKSPVAGIAMGLIKEGDDFAVLTDILGDEDHLGDMDFKVAGTKDGITALQMDIKITSINEAIMKQALEQARDGRLHILGEMAKALGESRDSVSENAPRIETLQVPVKKIRDIIGSGGKVIREICEVSGAKVDIDDDGTVMVSAVNAEAIQKALDMINGIIEEPEMNKIYEGKVTKIADFGAFVNFLSDSFGLVHISEITDERGHNAGDFVSVGDKVQVKVVGFDDRGKVKLSMKQVIGKSLELKTARNAG